MSCFPFSEYNIHVFANFKSYQIFKIECMIKYEYNANSLITGYFLMKLGHFSNLKSQKNVSAFNEILIRIKIQEML